MKKFGVKEVSKLSGVTARTLHYYDKIGLLKPSYRAESGYRYYEEGQLLRLQQILFYKELDFPLKEIAELLDDPDFDLVEALEDHKVALIKRQDRISNLLLTIKNTINHLKHGEIMSKPEMLYDGLPKETREEAIEKYGKETIEKSEADLVKMGKEGFANLQAELTRITAELFTMKDENSESESVQSAIANHYHVIQQFWGSSVAKDKHQDVYAGLGTLYVSDGRFTEVDGKPQPEFAAFMESAMGHYAKTQLG